MKGKKAQRILQREIVILAPLVKKLFVRKVKKDGFDNLGISKCPNYLHVHHMTDTTVLNNRPAGSCSETKSYFPFFSSMTSTKHCTICSLTGEHKIYCVKWEASCYPNGSLCNWKK